MKTILSEKLPRILKNKKRLEEILKIKISNRGKEVTIEGEAKDEFRAQKVIDAINFGFPFSTAILIKTEDFEFEILNIKEHTNRKDLSSVRARIIGKGGKTLKTLTDLSDCFFELKDNFVGIIGAPQLMKNAQESVTSIIRGSKQGNVYKFLEKRRFQEPVDLGLKE